MEIFAHLCNFCLICVIIDVFAVCCDTINFKPKFRIQSPRRNTAGNTHRTNVRFCIE